MAVKGGGMAVHDETEDEKSEVKLLKEVSER